MNRIQVSGTAFCLLLIQGKPIFSENRALVSANSNRPNRDGQSLVVGAGEKISSHEGKGRSNILVTEGGEVSHLYLYDTSSLKLFDSDKKNNSDEESVSIGHMTMYDSATALVKGGKIAHLHLYDTSSLKFDSDKKNNSDEESSSISHLDLYDSATASIRRGEIRYLDLYGASSVSILDGSEIYYLRLHERSSVSISGSQKIDRLTLEDETHGEIFNTVVSFLHLKDRSKVSVKSLDIQGGGLFSATGIEVTGVKVSGGAVILESDTALHIYAREIDFADGKLSGIWADGTHFEFQLIRRIRDNWFWLFWRAGDDAPEYEIPKLMPNQIIFHQI